MYSVIVHCCSPFIALSLIFSYIIVLDTEKSNYCGNKTGNYWEHYILKPNDIYVPSCDGNIFSIESNYTCGLYKDLFSDRIFKYYNKNKCYEKKPNNSIYLNEKVKIFKCNEGYNFKNGECIISSTSINQN